MIVSAKSTVNIVAESSNTVGQTCITKGTGSTSSQLQQCSLVDVHGDNPAIRSSSTMANEGSPSCEVEQCLSAKFHFVDLAGSERASKTGNRGERFKGECDSFYVNVYMEYIIDGLINPQSLYPGILGVSDPL